MRTKYLLMALAVPALFTACADDDFLTASQGHGSEVDGQLIELGEDFAIGLNRGGDAADTKTAWHYKVGDKEILYSWLPAFVTEGSNLTVQEENIGFAWRGEVGDSKVRTNYKFTLDGFLQNGQTAPKTIVCDNQVAVLNGYTFPRGTDGSITLTDESSTKKLVLQEYDATTKAMKTSSTYKLTYASGDYTLEGAKVTTVANGLLDNTKLAEKDPYVRNGIFTTDNSTVFKGEYIVYFPYNPEFAEIDYLPAVSPTEFTQDVTNHANRTAHLAGKTFGYGTATIKEGGSMAESFNTKNLSGIPIFNVKNSSEGNVTVQKLIFVDEGEGAKGFIKQVGLDASKIAAGATGTNLYVAGTEVYEPTLVLNLVKNGAAGSVISANGDPQQYTMAALPTKLVKPVLYIMNEKGMCCRKELEKKDIPAGAGVMYNVEITKDDKFDQALAVDTKTFIERVIAAGKGTTAATVNVLGNITLDPEAKVTMGNNNMAALKNQFDLNGNGNSLYINNDVTINGTGTITIPADLNILIKATGKKTLTIKNPVVIEGAGCCGNKPGLLMVTAPTNGEGTVVFDGAVENYGEMWLANNAETTSKTKVVFNNTVVNGIDEETVNEDNAGKIYCAGLFTGNSSVEFNGKVTNEGELNIQPSIKLIDDGQEFPYGQTAGEFYPNHKINSVVVSAQSIDNNGEIVVDKYTTLNVAGAVANKGAITVNTANKDGEESVDGRLEIANGASVANSGVVENFGVINNRGSLTNNDAEADIIDHIGSQFGGNKANAAQGEYICEVEDTNLDENGDRLEYAMGADMPTTTIKFVGAGNTENKNDGYTYDLGKYGKTEFNYDFIIATDAASAVNLKATKTTKVGENDVTSAVAVTINGKLTVEGNKNSMSTLNLSEIMLTVNDAVAVNGILNVNPTDAKIKTLEGEDKVAFTAVKDMNVAGEFTVNTFARTAMKGNLTIAEGATGTFNYATYTKIAQVLNINGKFVRVTSSGNQDSNPAQVWCSDWKEGSKSDIPNGLPQK